jgi:anti-sigma factor RsiW
MATKKQQRRKYQRAQGRGRLHEGYEPAQRDEESPRRKPDRDRPRGPRTPTPPTWMRSIKRAGLFAVGLFAAVQILPLGGGKPTLAAAALQAASFFVFLVPFGYLMDSFVYNRFLKRQ